MNAKMAKRMRAIARTLTSINPKMTTETVHVVRTKNPTTVLVSPLCLRGLYRAMKRYYQRGATK